MTQADTEDRDLSFQLPDGFLTDARIFRSSGTGREDQRLWFQGTDFIDGDLVVPHYRDLRIDASDELVQVIGKAVVIINQ